MKNELNRDKIESTFNAVIASIDSVNEMSEKLDIVIEKLNDTFDEIGEILDDIMR